MGKNGKVAILEKIMLWDQHDKMLFLIVWLAFVGIGLAQSQSTDTFYTEHNYRSFFKLPEVNRTIDLSDIDHRLLNAAVFHETNRQRVLHLKKKLVYAPALEQAAKIHSEKMVEHDFMSHENPFDAELVSVEKRMKKVGWPSKTVAENIADAFLIDYEGGKKLIVKEEGGEAVFYQPVFFGLFKKRVEIHTYKSFARALVRLWLDSPQHRENLLSKKYTHLGCGIFSGEVAMESGKIPIAKATQNFGRK